MTHAIDDAGTLKEGHDDCRDGDEGRRVESLETSKGTRATVCDGIPKTCERSAPLKFTADSRNSCLCKTWACP